MVERFAVGTPKMSVLLSPQDAPGGLVGVQPAFPVDGSHALPLSGWRFPFAVQRNRRKPTTLRHRVGLLKHHLVAAGSH